MRYGNNYPRFPAHLIQHLQPQLFPTTVDQRLHFASGAFRPFTVPTPQNKLFPSAFAPPLKTDNNSHDSIQEISPGPYVSSYYGSETEDDTNFRSNSDRGEVELQTGEQNSELELRQKTSSTPSPPQSSLTKDDGKTEIGNEKEMVENMDSDNSENRNMRSK